MKVVIESTELAKRSGTSKAGNAYEIFEQRALLFRTGEKYPDKFKVNVPSSNAAYPPGEYALCESSFSVSRFGGLEVSPVLLPLTKG